MSGLIDYVIMDDFFNSIKEEATCTICFDIKIDPIMCTKCQNSYCSKCIKNWSSKSKNCPYQCDSPTYQTARVVKNLICKLNFKCKNGCNKIIPFEKVQSHNEFECDKIDFREKYQKLMDRYNNLLEQNKELERNVEKIFHFQMDSVILENKNELFFIYNSLLLYIKKQFHLELLYRASRDGDNGRKFHELCDNKKGGILIIIKTDKNIKFGGFTDAEFISYQNPEKKAAGRNGYGNINFLFQINKRKIYNIKVGENNKKYAAIFCRSDVGPCFGELGEDIWIKPENFLQKGGILHKDKDKGRICSFDTNDYELSNGEPRFKIDELEAFWFKIDD